LKKRVRDPLKLNANERNYAESMRNVDANFVERQIPTTSKHSLKKQELLLLERAEHNQQKIRSSIKDFRNYKKVQRSVHFGSKTH